MKDEGQQAINDEAGTEDDGENDDKLVTRKNLNKFGARREKGE